MHFFREILIILLNPLITELYFLEVLFIQVTPFFIYISTPAVS